MEIEAMQQLIGSYGFPVVVCIFLLWDKKNERKEVAKERESLIAVVQQNTQAVVELRSVITAGRE